jgi:hypothetical protein
MKSAVSLTGARSASRDFCKEALDLEDVLASGLAFCNDIISFRNSAFSSWKES